MDIKIKSIMTLSPHSIGQDLSLQDAMSMMQEFGIRHLPVRNGKEVLGVLSDRDINFASRVDKKNLSEILVSEACSLEPYIVSGESLVSEVAQRMSELGIGSALVKDSGQLTGIFTSLDACRLLAEVLRDGSVSSKHE